MPFLMELNDARVARNFGSHPERGRRLTGISIQSTAGVVWKNYGRRLERAEVTVNPVVVLHCVKAGLWKVTVEPQYANAAKEWLTRYCTAKAVVPKERRRRQPQKRSSLQWGPWR